MAFMQVWLDIEPNIWVKGQMTGAEIENLQFRVSIQNKIIKLSSRINVPKEKNAIALLDLWIAPFIEYLAQNSLNDEDANTNLFRVIIEGIKREYIGHYRGSFTINIRTNSLAKDTNKLPFNFPEPEFLIVKQGLRQPNK